MKGKHTRTQPLFTVKVNDTSFTMLADSGASVNILTISDYEMLEDKPPLLPHNKYVYRYASNTPLDVRGKFQASLSTDRALCYASFIVCGGSDKSLLSWETSKQLRLIDTVKNLNTGKIKKPRIECCPTS